MMSLASAFSADPEHSPPTGFAYRCLSGLPSGVLYLPRPRIMRDQTAKFPAFQKYLPSLHMEAYVSRESIIFPLVC